MPDFISVPSITVLCYMIAQGYKAFAPEYNYKHIPAICMAAGCVIGVICYLFIPGYIPAENVITAGAIGALSGAAATGVNQVIKQCANNKSGR